MLQKSRNSPSSGMILLLYLNPIIRRVIQVIVLITEARNLSTVCKVLSDILLSSLTPYVYETFGDYHCET